MPIIAIRKIGEFFRGGLMDSIRCDWHRCGFRRFLQRCLRFNCVLAGLCCLTIAGCALPSYHFPQGFSSTYHRALWGPRERTRLEFIPEQLEEVEDTPGVFFPNSLHKPEVHGSPNMTKPEIGRSIDRAFLPPATHGPSAGRSAARR